LSTRCKSGADHEHHQWPGQQELQAWRHDFHRHPETAFQEHRTSARVAELLKSFGLEVHTGLAGTGVVAVLKGNMGAGPSIGLRADMDALHVTELNTCEHASSTPAACTPAATTAIPACCWARPRRWRPTRFAGTVHFIFQPAEENEGGARAMIADGCSSAFPWTRSTACTTGRACPWARRRCIPRP
jgi:hippurate hydrolase